MKKGRFLWSAHRITERQKAGKARSIKGKQLKNSRNTVSKLHVVLHSSANVNKEIIFRKREYQEKPILQGLQKLWKVVRCAGIYSVCNKYATKSMICIGHFQRNLGMSFFLYKILLIASTNSLMSKCVYTFSVSVIAPE